MERIVANPFSERIQKKKGKTKSQEPVRPQEKSVPKHMPSKKTKQIQSITKNQLT